MSACTHDAHCHGESHLSAGRMVHELVCDQCGPIKSLGSEPYTPDPKLAAVQQQAA